MTSALYSGYYGTVSDEVTPDPKQSETDPPAANQPSDEGSGASPEPRAPEPEDASGRTANDPSAPSGATSYTSGQVPRGKPDGEVDTGGGASSLADGRGRA